MTIDSGSLWVSAKGRTIEVDLNARPQALHSAGKRAAAKQVHGFLVPTVKKALKELRVPGLGNYDLKVRLFIDNKKEL